MALKIMLSLAVASLATAKAVTTSMLMIDTDPQPLVASIVGNDATATTYSINCPPGTDGSDCGMGPGLFVVAGPKTTSYMMDEPEADFHWTVVCSVAGTTSAVCTESAKGTGANFPGMSSTTISSDLPFIPVTINAGSVTSFDATATASASTSASATGTVTSTASATATGTASATRSQSSGTSAHASGTEDSASASGSSATSTGGMPQVTGGVGMMLGGAAVALAMVAL